MGRSGRREEDRCFERKTETETYEEKGGVAGPEREGRTRGAVVRLVMLGLGRVPPFAESSYLRVISQSLKCDTMRSSQLG